MLCHKIWEHFIIRDWQFHDIPISEKIKLKPNIFKSFVDTL